MNDTVNDKMVTILWTTALCIRQTANLFNDDVDLLLHPNRCELLAIDKRIQLHDTHNINVHLFSSAMITVIQPYYIGKSTRTP